MSLNDLNEPFANCMLSCSGLSRNTSLKDLVTAKVKKEALDAFGFGTDVVKLIHNKRSASVMNMNSVEALRFAYKQAVKREWKLNHALSRVQMECNENKTFFREAVDLAEKLKEENRTLVEKLNSQETTVFYLRQNLRASATNNEILVDELDDIRNSMRITARERAELSEINDRAKLKINEQETLINRIKDEHAFESGSRNEDIQEAFDVLVQELKQERMLRKKSNECSAETEAKLGEALWKIERLEKHNQELQTKVNRLTDQLDREVLQVCKDNAFQKLNYTELLRQYNEQQLWLEEVNEKLTEKRDVPALVEVGPLKGQTLDEHWNSVSNWTALSELEVDVNNDMDEISNDSHKDNDPATAEVFQLYLYITATAVKLHFPDLEVVEIDSLIEHVSSSPFYLYYDLMMNFMQEFKQKKTMEELKYADNFSRSRDDQWNLLARFKRLRQGRRESSESTKKSKESSRRSTRSVSLISLKDISGTSWQSELKNTQPDDQISSFRNTGSRLVSTSILV